MKNVLVLTTSTCIKCKSMLSSIENCLLEYKIPYHVGNAMKEFKDLVLKLNIQSVPTLVVYDESPENPNEVLTGDFSIEDLYTALDL